MAERVDVSVLVPVFNEVTIIRDTAADMLAQRFEGVIEFLFIDGRSTDGTRAILEEIAAADERALVLDNPDRHQGAALNLGLALARGQYVARMDAHTFYPPGYIAAGVERLSRGDVEWASGPQLAFGIDRWSRRVALAMTSPLGIGGAIFRRLPEHEIETDTGFTGILERGTLERLGGWDAAWPPNEDGELAARVARDRGRIVCLPQMAARWVPRGTVAGLARQYWRYGQYRAKTTLHHPGSGRRSHAVPPALALTALGAFLPGAVGIACRVGLAIYALALLVESIRLARLERTVDAAFVPLLLATMHFAWGFGFLLGCIRFTPGAILERIRGRGP